jgi:hypothetical protein
MLRQNRRGLSNMSVSAQAVFKAMRTSARSESSPTSATETATASRISAKRHGVLMSSLMGRFLLLLRSQSEVELKLCKENPNSPANRCFRRFNNPHSDCPTKLRWDASDSKQSVATNSIALPLSTFNTRFADQHPDTRPGNSSAWPKSSRKPLRA